MDNSPNNRVRFLFESRIAIALRLTILGGHLSFKLTPPLLAQLQ